MHDYKAGKAFFSGHMEPLYDLCQRFIDAGILNEDSFSYSATKIKEEFKAGKMAMIIEGRYPPKIKIEPLPTAVIRVVNSRPPTMPLLKFAWCLISLTFIRRHTS